MRTMRVPGAAAPQLERLWRLADAWWEHEEAVDWSSGLAEASAEVLEPELLAAIRGR